MLERLELAESGHVWRVVLAACCSRGGLTPLEPPTPTAALRLRRLAHLLLDVVEAVQTTARVIIAATTRLLLLGTRRIEAAATVL